MIRLYVGRQKARCKLQLDTRTLIKFTLNVNICAWAVSTLYLRLQVWIVSHVNQQAVEGGQAPRVSPVAGTPCGTDSKFTFCTLTTERQPSVRAVRAVS